jgi:hypothetical protein
MKIVAGFVAFSMTLTSAFSFAAGPQCTDANLGHYMKTGDLGDQAPDKIYRFAELRHDIIQNIADPHKTKCLNDAYQSGLEQEATYWGKRLSQAGCKLDADGDVPDNCPIADEVRESNEFLYNLENDSNATIRRAIQISRAVASEDRATTAPTCSAAPQSIRSTALQLHQISCCGSPNAKSGAVRINEPEISYQECLGKIGENTHSVADSVISCAGSVIKGVVGAIWESIKGLWHLPAMIGQVWSLMTNTSARNAFFAKITEFLKAKGEAVYSCYNGHEAAQEICRDAGALITMFAAPEATAALIGILAKPLSVLARAKALEGILATTSKGKAFLGKLGKADAAAAPGGAARAAAARAAAQSRDLALAAAQKARKAASRVRAATPRVIKAPIKFTGNRIKDLNNFRKWLGRPLSIPAEKAAALASRTGVYKRMLERAVRSEEQARGRAVAAGGVAARAEAIIPRSAAVKEALGSAPAAPAPAQPATGASGTNGIRVSYGEPMPSAPLKRGPRLGEKPQGGISTSRSYTQTDPMAGQPPLRPGARLGTTPEGGTSFRVSVKGKPAEAAPEVNTTVRYNGGEARPVPRAEPRVQPVNSQARAAVAKINSEIDDFAKPRGSRPRASAVEVAAPEAVSARAVADDLHSRVRELKSKDLISPEEAARLHQEINAGYRKAFGEDLPGRRELRAQARDVDAEAAPAAEPAQPASRPAIEAPAPPSNAQRGSRASEPTVVVRNVVRTERELTDSRNYLDRFSKKIEKLSSDPARNEREALRAFQSARPDKVRLEADRLHSQVEDLISANRITTAQATSFHENISLGESYATKSPTVREWKPAAQVETPPLAAAPVKRLVQPEPIRPQTPAASAPTESNDFVYPPERPSATVPAPLKTAPVQPAKVAPTEPPPAGSAPASPTTAAPLRPSDRALVASYQSTLESVAPEFSMDVPARDSYLTNKYWRTWAGTGDVPAQGWKLHVSATPEKAEKIARLLLPELRRMKIGHKIATDLGEYISRPATNSQFGKFITIYPQTADEARRVAALTEKLMKRAGLKAGDFPTPPGEQVAGVGVFARYGRLKGGFLKDANGRNIPNSYDMVQTPDGRLVPDNREESFAFAGQLVPPKKPSLLQRTRDRFRRGSDAAEVAPEAVPASALKAAKPKTPQIVGAAVVSGIANRNRVSTSKPKRKGARTNATRSQSADRSSTPQAAPVTAPDRPSDALAPDTLIDTASDAAASAANDAASAAASAPPAAPAAPAVAPAAAPTN